MFGTKRVRTLLTAAGVAVVALVGTVATTTIARADVASTFTFDNYPGLRFDGTVKWVADGRKVELSVDSFKAASNDTWPPYFEARAYDVNGDLQAQTGKVFITDNTQFDFITLDADDSRILPHVEVEAHGAEDQRPGRPGGVFVNQADCDLGLSPCATVYP
jgi:hypothetical protein